MSDIFINEQDVSLADAFIADYLHTRPNNSALHCVTALQITPDNSYPSCIPHQNSLGLYGTSGADFDQAADAFAYTSATCPSNQTGHPFFSTSFLHQSPPLDSLWQWSTSHYPSVCEEAALAVVGENLISHSFPPTSPEFYPAQRPSAHLPGKRISQALSEPAPPLQPRHTPYPMSTRRRAMPAPVYQCQWFEGATPCGELLEGTKGAIGRHLQKAHGLPLTADKTVLACRWDACGRTMQRESISRHILAVHMQNKVSCPACKSRFARTDSLQRHQKTQCLAGTEIIDTQAGNTGA